ncbi:unnamed protein product [Pedinophyceae sp. YPF-701]|nr:unnamed protein product [Pedinophyceae sp. YPF-701]
MGSMDEPDPGATPPGPVPGLELADSAGPSNLDAGTAHGLAAIRDAGGDDDNLSSPPGSQVCGGKRFRDGGQGLGGSPLKMPSPANGRRTSGASELNVLHDLSIMSQQAGAVVDDSFLRHLQTCRDLATAGAREENAAARSELDAWCHARQLRCIEDVVSGIARRSGIILEAALEPAEVHKCLLQALNDNDTLRRTGHVPTHTVAWLRERCEDAKEGGWEYATRLAFSVCGHEVQSLHMLLRAVRAAGATKHDARAWVSLLMAATASKSWTDPGGSVMASACAESLLYEDVDAHREEHGDEKVPTAEQRAVSEFVLSGDGDGPNVLLVPSGAGSGKTSTIEDFCEKQCGYRGMKFLYAAYNVRVRLEATERLQARLAPKDVHSSVKTLHGLAFVATEVFNRPDAKEEVMRNGKLEKVVSVVGNLSLLEVRNKLVEFGVDVNARKGLTADVRGTIEGFENSADPEIALHHVPWRRTSPSPPGEIAALARRVWSCVEERTDKSFRLTHNAYLKICQLEVLRWGAPLQRADVLIVDEGQDLNPVMIDIILRGGWKRIVIVGDPAQAIYAWRGAVDALAAVRMRLPGARITERRLSQSYRFGASIAAAANSLLALNGAPLGTRLIGAAAHGDVWHGHLPPIVGNSEKVWPQWLAEMKRRPPARRRKITLIGYTWFSLVVAAIQVADAGLTFTIPCPPGKNVGAKVSTIECRAKLMLDILQLLRAAEGEIDLRDVRFESSDVIMKDIRKQIDDPAISMTAEDALEYMEQSNTAWHFQSVSMVREAARVGHFPGCEDPPEASLRKLLRLTEVLKRAHRLTADVPVVLETIHQSKGAEWDRVLVLGGSLMEMDRATKQLNANQWGVGMQQAVNLLYVAVTRARHLVVVPRVITDALEGEVPVAACRAMATRLVLRHKRDLEGWEGGCLLCRNSWSDYFGAVCTDPKSPWNRDPGLRVACVRSPVSAMLRLAAEGPAAAPLPSVAGVICSTCVLATVLGRGQATGAAGPAQADGGADAVMTDAAVDALRRHWQASIAPFDRALSQLLGLDDAPRARTLAAAIAAVARCAYPRGPVPAPPSGSACADAAAGSPCPFSGSHVAWAYEELWRRLGRISSTESMRAVSDRIKHICLSRVQVGPEWCEWRAWTAGPAAADAPGPRDCGAKH